MNWDNITGSAGRRFKSAKVVLKARRSNWFLALFDDSSRRGWLLFERVRERWSCRTILDNNVVTPAGDAQEKANKFISEWAILMSKVRRRVGRKSPLLMQKYSRMWKKPKLY